MDSLANSSSLCR